MKLTGGPFSFLFLSPGYLLNTEAQVLLHPLLLLVELGILNSNPDLTSDISEQIHFLIIGGGSEHSATRAELLNFLVASMPLTLGIAISMTIT